MDRISVILVHSGAVRFREQVYAASRRGLLRKLVLVDELEQYELVDSDKKRSINLFEYLSQQQISDLHLLAVRFGSSQVRIDAKTEYQLAETLRTRLQLVQSTFTAGTLSLMSEGDPLDIGHFQATWKYNLLISPEDWAGQPGFLAANLKDSDYEDLAFASASVVTSSWNWIDGSVHENFVSKVVVTDSVVRMARIVLRIIDAGDLAVRITSAALDQSGMWPVPQGCMFHPDPRAFVAEKTDEIVSSTSINFLFKTLEGAPDLGGGKPIGLREVIKLFFKMLGSAIIGQALKIVNDTKMKAKHFVEDLAQDLTFGHDSEVLVRLGGKPRPEDGLVSTGAKLGIVSSLPKLRPLSPQPTPETWSSFVAQVLGTFDGGEESIVTSNSKGETKLVLSDRTFVAYNPHEEDSELTLTIEEIESLGMHSDTNLSIRYADPMTLGDLEAILKSAEDSQSNKSTSDGSKPGLKESRARVRKKIEYFKSKREHTLVWRIGKRLHDEVNFALGAWLDSEKLLVGLGDVINEEVAALEKSAKKIKKRQIITALILFVLAALVAVLFILATVLLAVIAFGFLVTYLISSVVSFIKLAREQVRHENRIKAAMSLPEYLMRTRVHCHQEYVRLTSMYEQYLDWAEVVGSVIYQPFGGNQISDVAEPYETISDVTCFVVGTPDMNNEAIVGEKQKLRRNLVKRGWLTSLVLQMEQSWKPRYARISGQQVDEVQRPEADAAIQMYSQYVISDDDSDGITTPRQHFKREVMSGLLSAQLRLAVEESMRQVLRAGDPTRLLGNVGCKIEGLNNSSPTDFLLPPILMSPLPGFDAFIRRDVVGSDGLVQAVSYGLAALTNFEEPVDDVSRTRIAVAPVDERFVLAGFRLDLSREMNPGDVLLVKQATRKPKSDEDEEKVVVPHIETDF